MRTHCLLSAVALTLVAGLTTLLAASAQTFDSSQDVTTQGRLRARTPRESLLMQHRIQLPSQREHAQPSAIPDATFALPGGTAPNFGGFYAAPQTKAGTQGSMATLVGDFNNDGKPDLVNIGQSGEIDVLLNDGKGGFGPPVVNPMTPALPFGYDFFNGTALAVDLNGDGYTDIVLLGSKDPHQSPVALVLINQKNGTFASTELMLPNLNPPLSVQSYAQVAGKTTNSGHIDIVTAEQYRPNQIVVQTFQNDGTGTFSASSSQTFTVPSTEKFDPSGRMNLLLNDANRDGKQDLLLERQATTDVGIYVDILLGNGDGTFQSPAGNTTVNVPWSSVSSSANSDVVAQILTGDPSKADLILNNGSEIFVAMSNGDGTFQTPKQILQAEASTQIQIADLNGDGKADLIRTEWGGLVSYLGNGDGTFGAIAGTAVADGSPGSANLNHTVLADFNGDGKIDFANGDLNGNVEVAFGNGDGTFIAAPLLYSAKSQAIAPSAFWAQAAVDLNGDGVTDLVAMGPASVFTALANDKGGFTYQTALLPADYPVRYIAPVAADFNGDGKQDVVLIGWGGTAALALSNGDGTLKTPVNVINPAVKLACDLYDTAVGDVDGDGKLDLVFAYPGDSYCGKGTAVPSGYFVAKGNGDGTFHSPIFSPLGVEISFTKLAYFHGKTKPLDIVVTDLGARFTNETTSILTGNGDGTFGIAVTVNTGDRISEILTDDFNQDGMADLTLITSSNNQGMGGALLYAGNGDGTFASPTTFVEQNNVGFDGVYTDVNGDSIPDLITSGSSHGLSVALGTGKGGFAAPINYFFASAFGEVLAGNFLGDNTQSVVGFTDFGGGTAFFMNQGGTSLAVIASTASIGSGQSLSLTVALTPTLPGRPIPTGTVAYYDGTALIGSGAVGTSVATDQLTIGSHSITAAYSGDVNFNPHTSAPVVVTVSMPPPAPDFTITPATATLSLTKGQSGSVNLTIAANAGLNGTVTFQCDGLPLESTCTFTPAHLTVASGSSATVTLNMGTKAASRLQLQPQYRSGLTTLGGIVVAGLLVFFPRKRARWMLLFAGITLGGLAGLSGCGGGGGGGSTTPLDPGTPSGATNMTVTATAVSGTTTVKHTITIALTVQ